MKNTLRLRCSRGPAASEPEPGNSATVKANTASSVAPRFPVTAGRYVVTVAYGSEEVP